MTRVRVARIAMDVRLVDGEPVVRFRALPRDAGVEPAPWSEASAREIHAQLGRLLAIADHMSSPGPGPTEQDRRIGPGDATTDETSSGPGLLPAPGPEDIPHDGPPPEVSA